MNRSSFFLLITLLCGFYSSSGQATVKGGDDETFLQNPHKVTQVKLDSAFNVLRDAYYESNFSTIIEETPTLIKKSDSINYKIISTRLRSLLGNSFIQIDDFDQAETIFNSALTRAKKLQDSTAIVSSYINLSNVYIISNPDKAIGYLKQASSVFENLQENDNSNLIAFILHNNLSELYVGTAQTEEAKFNSLKAQYILEHTDIGERNNEALAAVYFVRGNIALLENNYTDAIALSNKSLEIGSDILDENYLINIYKNLIDSYDKSNRLIELNVARKVLDSLKDKRYEGEKLRQQEIAKIKYNIKIYQQQLRESKLKNEIIDEKASRNKILLIASCIVGVLFFILSGVLLYARKKRILLLKSLKIKNRQFLRAKEESEKMAHSKTALLSTISHELRTPLYGIIGLTSVFLEDPELKNQKEDLVSLKFSADYLLALVNDVLHLNKLSSNEGRAVKEVPFNLEELIKGSAQSFEFINKNNNNRVAITYDKKIPELLVGDKTKISQILMNLISNASKFTEDGVIKIIATRISKTDNSCKVKFSIADTGIGILEEKQQKIFEEFSQVSTLDGKGGSGLGLSIVNKILTILKSRLTLNSVYGEGTKFSFELNFKLENENYNPQVTTSLIDREKLENKSILIVDDNKINQIVTQKVLDTFGIKHQTASNGLEAIKKVQNHTFDLILMDINMPIMNGKDASKNIRDLNVNTPIIALSATDYIDIDKELYPYGINDNIVKPYDNDQLLKLLARYIQ